MAQIYAFEMAAEHKEDGLIRLELPPEEAFDPVRLDESLRRRVQASPEQRLVIHKRSIDARSRNIKVLITFSMEAADAPLGIRYTRQLPDVRRAPRVLIAGAGPAGLFAALKLIESGFCPVILERGKDVRARRRDIAAINKEHVVDPDSNYCFGEGGAGTYSDGKLYTRSVKRGDLRRILEILHVHGAREEILYDAHPHIGTNKLPGIIAAMRETILDAGGEIRFGTRITGIRIAFGEVKGVDLAGGEALDGERLILATGHSARDVFRMLHHQKILIEAKPFAIGVRVEHPQMLIDSVQYHCAGDRGPWLPAAAYALVQQVESAGSRGVFSFCMCPGGFIVPAATAPGEIVVNGMSPSRRDSRFANSGIVVAVDMPDFHRSGLHGTSEGPLAGLEFQAAIERRACIQGGQYAPAQRLEDFVQKRSSTSLNDTSYQPGLVSADMDAILPAFLSHALREGFRSFGKKMRGYLTNEAQVVGVESRTSSPVRIPRDAETLEHPQIRGLYPCGEGAGYAGGIVSAAMDGERVAEAIAKRVALHS